MTTILVEAVPFAALSLVAASGLMRSLGGRPSRAAGNVFLGGVTLYLCWVALAITI